MKKNSVPTDIPQELAAALGAEPSVEKLRELRFRLHDLEVQTRRTHHSYAEESPKMAFVQQLAGAHLRYLHDTRGMSHADIGEMFEVSTERARSLYHKLAVTDKDREKLST